MTNKAIVSFLRCDNYSSDMQAVVEKLLADIGGIEKFVKPGQKVLLKPNMLTARTPEQATTTHPEVVRAVIRIVKAQGAIVSVGDSPANITKISELWDTTGIKKVCDEEGVPLLNFENAGSETLTIYGTSINIAKPVMEADVIITLPKVKTHVLTTYTGAVKNLYGTIPGFQKTMIHKMFPKPNAFGRFIAALYDEICPQLAIADGILGMDGEGPSGGNPFQLNFLAASADSAALDSSICRLLDINVNAVGYLKTIGHEQIGIITEDDIELRGTPLIEIKPIDFHVPSTLRTRLIPGWLVKLVDPFVWIRPDFGDKCVFCGKCINACPVDALTINKGEKPFLPDPEKCIGCCCCHEICPEHAIEMQQSPLLSFVKKIG
ncbi:MAG: DUF362 domain-containing protein [Kiritimatiellae bacterium]|nr:DUF362 domain-containing protein [Kiritimatiellia bacterium]